MQRNGQHLASRGKGVPNQRATPCWLQPRIREFRVSEKFQRACNKGVRWLGSSLLTASAERQSATCKKGFFVFHAPFFATV